MKIAVIGGGSTYTPELMEGLINERERLGLKAVFLMDIDESRLRIVGDFCRRMIEHADAGFRVATTMDREETLDGADFVLTQIRVGGQEARHKDIQLGIEHGLVGQETTGVGGFAKAMRTVPVVLRLCHEMEHRCPNAWLINFTNPSGLVTEAVVKHGRDKVLGLCNIPINLQIDVAKHLGVDHSKVELDYLGMNHLSWVRRVWLEGKDVLPETLAALTGKGKPANIPEELDYPESFVRALGMIPSSYLKYFYQTRKAVDELKKKSKSRAQEVMEVERELLAAFQDSDLTEKPASLQKRGGAYYSRAALDLILAIHEDTGSRHVVNVRNGSTLVCLPEDCVVEVACRVDARGAAPLPLEPPPPEIRGLMQHVKAYEELTVKAAVTGSKDAAVLALATHPLVADVDLAVELVDEISRVHAIEWRQPAS